MKNVNSVSKVSKSTAVKRVQKKNTKKFTKSKKSEKKSTNEKTESLQFPLRGKELTKPQIASKKTQVLSNNRPVNSIYKSKVISIQEKKKTPLQGETGTLGQDRSMKDILASATKGIQALPSVKTELVKGSEKSFQRGIASIQKLSRNEQKTRSTSLKMRETESAVVPPKEEAQSRSNAAQIESVQKAQTPTISEKSAKDELRAALVKNLPKTEEEAKDFVKNKKGQKVGELITKSVINQSEGVKNTYASVQNNQEVKAEKPKAKMPAIESVEETSNLNLSQGLLPKIDPKQTDFSAFTNASDEMLVNEKISDDLLNMVDSGDLLEAKIERQNLKQDAEKLPNEAKEVEGKQHNETSQLLEQEEKKTRLEMRSQRNSGLKNSRGKQEKAKSELEKKREEVTDYINGIYSTAEKEVKEKLEQLEKDALMNFQKGEKEASTSFDQNVNERLDAFFDERYSEGGGFVGGFLAVKDFFAGSDDLPGVLAIFDSERETYVAAMDLLVEEISSKNKLVIEACKGIVEKANAEIKAYLDTLDGDLRKTGEKAFSAIEDKLSQLTDQINKKEESLQKKLEELRTKAIEQIDKKIEAIKEKMSGALSKLGKLLLNAAKKLFKWALGLFGYTAEDLFKVIDKGSKILSAIITSPIEFFKNLGRGIGIGFDNFIKNIKQHLINGLIAYLTGAVGGVFTIPSKFNAMGVFKMLLSALDIGYGFVRKIAVRFLGEKSISKAEKGFDMVKTLVTEGPLGLWEDLKTEISSFKETVVTSIQEWITTKIVQNATVKLLLMLNPVGAFVQAVKAIYDAVMFFVENWQRILDFVNSIFNSIGDIAMGKVQSAAKYIEKAMALTIPLLMSFFARFIGLGGIGQKIKKVLNKLRLKIQKVIEKAVKKIVEKIKKWLGKGKKTNGKTEKLSKEEHNKRVKDGMKYLHREEEKIDKDKNNSISLEEAESIAKKTKSKHNVFKSITPVKDGDYWSYNWTGSKGTEKSKKKVEDRTNGKVLHKNSFETYTKNEAVFQDKRKDQKLIGHRVHVNKVKGYIVGNTRSEKYYIKNLSEKNYRNKFRELKKVSSLDGRREIIGAKPSPHNEFEPEILFVRKNTPKEGLETVYYKHKFGRSKFSVVTDIKTGLTERIRGVAVKYHDLGRGITQGKTISGLDRTHLIANEIAGTGYSEGGNLVYASSHFNRVTMREVEIRMEKYLKAEYGDKLDSFSLSVSVEWAKEKAIVKYADIKKSINERIEKISKNTGDQMVEEKKLLENLLKKSASEIKTEITKNIKDIGQPRIMNVNYHVIKVRLNNGQEVRKSEHFETGIDHLFGTVKLNK